MLTTTILSVIAFAGAALAAPAWGPPGTVPHNSINPVPDTLGGNGVTIRKFQPLLHIAHGCQPYPAVNNNNQVSGGLKDTGNHAAGCRDTSKGQTYTRSAWYNGRFGIMYAWYMPKDQPADGNWPSGHRHDWETTVVWLNANSENARIIGGATSGHGKFKKTATPKARGSNVKVEYYTNLGLDHELQFTDTTGRSYWLYDWDAMPEIVKSALNQANFGKANCPFNDNNFRNTLAKAF
ncbi:necrosis and ethylene-inducing protein and ethylene inducing peptide [Fimicolochytrium jonesii]|uniref:necrosis and ethylene-inducing protein and ethylene inducing peptide n=1 Tax=Fimicolochytrium jonesii TaxID=1396493 RepID=UPI0022FEC55D|nr:necrosis and ethylene-inducing protein and ethylene inducing peptide [Fimicolochytrium jonesii]KAI8818801.1 necrosis and ethylene-inducing protein and ethylene inducing peptide [Fimicolochytrium jonesii]